MEHLTRSGAGVLLDAPNANLAEFSRTLLQNLEEHRFALIRNGPRTLPEAVELLARFGPINNAATRVDGAVLVDVRDDEVFRSNAALPLHKDGLLTGFDVRIVGIFCVDFVEIEAGRTYVSDANRALERMASEDLAILRERGVEGLAVDNSGYFREEHATNWHRLSAFAKNSRGEETLNLGLPHAPGERESWKVRIPDVSEETSDRVLHSLREALLDDDYVYWHEWREGDLLVMDNFAVLHGREAFRGTRRRLGNIQVLAP